MCAVSGRSLTMSEPLHRLVPMYRTADEWPNTQHGPIVLAWNEPDKRFDVTSTEEVRHDVRRYRFWHPDRRKEDCVIEHADRRIAK